jgi:FKBP-type peptidyl-prolyl cis-trans isomerase
MQPTRRILLIASAALALAASGCGSGDDKTTSAATPPTPAPSPEPQTAPARPKPKVTVPKGPAPTKLVIKDLIKGKGAGAKNGDPLVVNYVGVLYKTGKQFDASYDRGQPFPITLGVTSVISGWTNGLVGMKVGGRRELIIPPDEGYGPDGSPPVIPPNATLVFVIDLLSNG